MMNTNMHELVAAIYAATVPREDFNRSIDRLEELLFPDEAGEHDLARTRRIDDTVLAHIEHARTIQERLGQVRTGEPKSVSILESIPNPSYLVRAPELVVSANALALARHGRLPQTLRDLLVDEDILRKVREFILSKDPNGLLAVAGQPEPGRRTQTSVLVKRVDPDLIERSSEPCFLLCIVDFGFGHAAVELFRNAYGLSRAEARVAVLLASGLRLPDIAAERRVTVSTVRTQIKLIKYKTSVPDIPALVRLLCGFSAGVLASTANSFEPAAAHAISEPLKQRRQLVLRDGRRLQYAEQGAAGGDPVLMFHNLPYGVELPESAIRQAHRERLRFVAPFRPGFGGSDMVGASSSHDLLDRAACDARELLDHLAVERAVVVSHSAGAAFALRFARLFPGRVSRLVGVGRAPVWRDEWMKTTPKRQRLMLQMTRHFPQMLPLVAAAMVSVMEGRFAGEFVTHNCKDSPADLHALRTSPEIGDLIATSSVEALRNGLTGFCQECRIALVDFTEEARMTPHKFHILHGSDDVIVDPAQSIAFAEAVPGTAVEMVEGAGQLLFFSHWHHVFEAVRSGSPAPGPRVRRLSSAMA